MWDEDAWMEFREEALRNAEKRMDDFITEWAHGYEEPIMVKMDSVKHELTVYTCHPGLLIGKAGSLVEWAEKRLGELYQWDNPKINFVETEYVCNVRPLFRQGVKTSIAALQELIKEGAE